MALTNYKLGDLIELCEARNESLQYGLDDVKGISIQKIFIETKADMAGVSLRPYYLVQPDDFAYVTVTSRNGEKITLAHNTTDKTYIVSSSYVVFRVKRKDLLHSDFLFMYFNRPEFDRFSRFNSWGSARETFSWEDMCDIDIELPPLPVQQKYVDVYNAMLANQKSYERGLDDLKLTCDAYIEDLRRKIPCEPIGRYSKIIDDRNIGEKITNIKGLTVYKKFIETKADMNGVSLSNYKIVRIGDIAYVPTTNRNGDRIACGLCAEECIVSSIYEVMRTDKEHLLPEFLFMWFKRSEFDRWVRYNSWGSARETIEWNEISNFEIPIPDIKIQQAIVDIFSSYQTRYDINEKLKAQIKNICPILIKGFIEEARKEA